MANNPITLDLINGSYSLPFAASHNQRFQLAASGIGEGRCQLYSAERGPQGQDVPAFHQGTPIGFTGDGELWIRLPAGDYAFLGHDLPDGARVVVTVLEE